MNWHINKGLEAHSGDYSYHIMIKPGLAYLTRTDSQGQINRMGTYQGDMATRLAKDDAMRWDNELQ